MASEESSASQPPLVSPFNLMGGEAPVRALVERFYDLMELEPSYARFARKPRGQFV